MIDLSRGNPLFDLEASDPPLLRARDPRLEAAAAFLNDAAQGIPPFRHLPERVRAGDDFAAEPLASAAPVEESQTTGADRQWWRNQIGDAPDGFYAIAYGSGAMGRTRSLVPGAVLIEVFEQLLALRLRSTDVWLFRYSPIWWLPAPSERSTVETLEQRAGSFSPAERPEFLDAMASAGLFSPIFYADRERCLLEWQCACLMRWTKAGRALLAYVQSWPRKRRVPSPFLTGDVNQSPVDISVFLDSETPWPDADRDDWLAALEATLGDVAAGTQTGETMAENQSGRFRLGWRRTRDRVVLERIRAA
jgi:hypothetical protein